MRRINFVTSTLLAVCMLLSIMACQKESSPASSASPAAATTTTAVTTDTNTDTTQIPGLGVLTGQLAMDVNGANVPAANAEVTVASHPEYKATTDAEGNFEIANMLPGTLTIYAEGTTGTSLKLANDDSIRAAQFRDIIVAANQNTALPTDTVLTKPGSISGTVALLNNPQNVELVGISVYVPGTSYDATTDENGLFTLSNIPAGLYSIRFDKEGLTSSEIADVTVQSGADTALTTVYMSLSTGPSGQITSINNTTDITIGSAAKKVLQSHDVTVNILYDSRAVLMKVAHESAFLNVDWIPVASSYTFTASNNASAYSDFSTDGIKNVYVKFADQNGLESSVYYQEIIIDTDNPSVSSVILLNGWEQVATTASGIHMTISAADSGTGLDKMMVCNNNSWTGCSWVDYSTSYVSSSIITGAGTNTVYVQTKDFLGNISSDFATDTIVGGTETIIPSGTYSDDVTLYVEESPFKFVGAITFQENFTIRPGVVLKFEEATTDSGITINGKFYAVGTSINKITFDIVNGDFLGFNLSNSTEYNEISYWQFNDSLNNGSILFTMSGGVISNSIFTLDYDYLLQKVGFGFLTISGNTINCNWNCFKISSGTNATTFYDNNITLISGNSPTLLTQDTTATGTTFRYNTISYTTSENASALSYGYVIFVDKGEFVAEHNNFVFDTTNAGGTPGNVVGIGFSDGTTATISNNNFYANSTGTGNAYHYAINGTASVDSSGNYYRKPDESTGVVNYIGSLNSTTSEATSALETASGSSCEVGHNCN